MEVTAKQLIESVVEGTDAGKAVGVALTEVRVKKQKKTSAQRAKEKRQRKRRKNKPKDPKRARAAKKFARSSKGKALSKARGRFVSRTASAPVVPSNLAELQYRVLLQQVIEALREFEDESMERLACRAESIMTRYDTVNESDDAAAAEARLHERAAKLLTQSFDKLGEAGFFEDYSDDGGALSGEK